MASDALASFGRGKHIFGLNKGQFSMLDIASAMLDITGPGHVSCWTWVAGEHEIEAVSGFLNSGKILSFRLVIDFSGGRRDLPYFVELQRKYGNDCIRITKTHAKIVTIENDQGWNVVVRGSMNLNRNPRFEQFDVSDDRSVFDCVRGIEAEMWEKGKPLPIRELAHHDAAELLRSTGESLDVPEWAPSPLATGKAKSWF